MFYDCYTALCQARGISRSRAAQEMGLSNSTVTKWKNTGATPSGETLARVSAYFGVPVGELLGEAVPSVQEERKLPEGASLLDFAFDIHGSAAGHGACRPAHVCGRKH